MVFYKKDKPISYGISITSGLQNVLNEYIK